jgi:hypothetical protein
MRISFFMHRQNSLPGFYRVLYGNPLREQLMFFIKSVLNLYGYWLFTEVLVKSYLDAVVSPMRLFKIKKR